MERRRRVFLELGSRYPHLARRALRRASDRFRDNPTGLLRRLITTWAHPDQILFRRDDVFNLFLQDLHQVLTFGNGAEGLSQELRLFRNYGVPLDQLPTDRRVCLWQGLHDTIVPPSMAWAMARLIPNCEAHFVPGGHFVAIDIADQIVARLVQLLDEPAGREEN
jgi:pimeloyl-ACP methyl ester carboxylesterase